MRFIDLGAVAGGSWGLRERTLVGGDEAMTNTVAMSFDLDAAIYMSVTAGLTSAGPRNAIRIYLNRRGDVADSVL